MRVTLKNVSGEVSVTTEGTWKGSVRVDHDGITRILTAKNDRNFAFSMEAEKKADLDFTFEGKGDMTATVSVGRIEVEIAVEG